MLYMLYFTLWMLLRQGTVWSLYKLYLILDTKICNIIYTSYKIRIQPGSKGSARVTMPLLT
jgi:hypothetical protein